MLLQRAKMQALWKEGWVKIPEVMAVTTAAILSCFFGYGCYRYKTDKYGWCEKYKKRYLVVRSDDPRAKKLQTYSSLD